MKDIYRQEKRKNRRSKLVQIVLIEFNVLIIKVIALMGYSNKDTRGKRDRKRQDRRP